MKTTLLRLLTSAALLALAVPARAQCNQVLTGLRAPQGTTLTNQGNLLVSEAGLAAPLHTGRISIVEPSGARRTLIDGLPSAIADVGDVSGPAGLAMRGRTLYVAMGVGDVAIRTPGMPPTTALENPNGPSSPLFSSVLMIHVSAAIERTTTGFTMTTADQQALANGEVVRLSNGGPEQLTVQMIANFPNFIPEPLLGVLLNIRVSNPFGLIAEGSSLYVTDGSRNLVWEVDLATGAFEPLPVFANLTNTLFPGLGFPTMEPVATGIASDEGNLLVALFGGFPFSPGASRVMQVDPVSGTATPFINGLKSPIGIVPFRRQGESSYLILQHASAGPFFGSPGVVRRFDDPAGPSTTIANCLARPTSMTLNEKAGTLYVTEFGGRLVSIPFAP